MDYTLSHLLDEAELIADMIVKRLSPIKDDMSTREAYAAFGRQWVSEVVKAGKIHPYRSGNRTIYSRTELDALRVLERRHANFITQQTR